MHVHVVRAENQWIIKRIAESIRIDGITVGDRPEPTADINFYVHYAGMPEKLPNGTVNVAYMTHLPALVDDGGWRREKFRKCAMRADHCVAMSRNTAKDCPEFKTSIWAGAPDPEFVKPTLRLGVACKPSRRKGLDRIEALRALPGVEVTHTGGTLSSAELVAWYRSIDYLVVTSDTEGGPFPVMEAIASGKPVIAPNVGFCWEHPCLQYDGTTAGLVKLVRRLQFPADPWGVASRVLEGIFERLLNG